MTTATEAFLQGYLQKTASRWEDFKAWRAERAAQRPGRVVNAGEEFLPYFYGDQAKAEAAKADAYNASIGAPYRMAKYWDPVRLYENDVQPRAFFHRKVNEHMPSSYFISKNPLMEAHVASRPALDEATFRGFDDATLQANGFTREQVNRPPTRDDIRGTLMHELAHYVTVPTVKAYQAFDRWLRRTSPQQPGNWSGVNTYPEMVSVETIPPLTALQQHLFKTTGSRLETPEAYDEYMAKWDKIPKHQLEDALAELPIEVQRLHRYRRVMMNSRTPLSASNARARLDWYDKVNRRLVPGLVNRQTNDRHTRTA